MQHHKLIIEPRMLPKLQILVVIHAGELAINYTIKQYRKWSVSFWNSTADKCFFTTQINNLNNRPPMHKTLQNKTHQWVHLKAISKGLARDPSETKRATKPSLHGSKCWKPKPTWNRESWKQLLQTHFGPTLNVQILAYQENADLC